MPKLNAYIAAKNAERQQCFVAGCDTAEQQMIDMLCLVLHDPAIMGKDTFGAERLRKVIAALYEREKVYHEAWTHTQESDYYQEKLDAGLKEIFGEETDPFRVRYPYAKEWDYKKAKK